jgi:GT2 family glycosyltransferase
MSAVRAFAIVVAHDGGDDLLRCVDALLVGGTVPLRVLVVDNASRDSACDRIEGGGDAGVDRAAGARVVVRRMARNLGFAGGVNAGVDHLERTSKLAADDVLVLVNQDCIVAPGAVAALVTRLEDARVGIVGARLFAADGATLSHAGGRVHANGLTEHHGRGQAGGSAAFSRAADVEYVTGALMAFRVSTWRALGPLDAAYHPVYFEDVDYCMRARAAGMRVVYEPRSVAVHAEASASGGPQSRAYLTRYHRSRMRFVARHRLRRGALVRALAAELRWLSARRHVSELTPAQRAYHTLPYQMAVRRRPSVAVYE